MVIAAAIALMHFIIGCTLFIPSFYSHEAMYLINARSLLGHQNNYGNPYAIGMSLLLVPATIFHHPLAPYTLAILYNSLSLGVMFWLLVRISKNEGARHPLMTGLIASCYPSLWLYANHAIPEILLTLIVTLAYLLVASYQTARRPALLYGFALLTIISCTLHPRMAPLAVISVVFALYFLLRHHGSWRGALALIIGAAALMALNYHLKSYANQFQAVSGLRLTDPYTQIVQINLRGWLNFPLMTLFLTFGALCGQLLYLSLATLGIGFVALYHTGVSQASALRERAISCRHAYLLSAFAATLALTSLQKIQIVVTSQAFFGRYLEIFSPLLIVVGISILDGTVVDRAGRKRLWLQFAALSGLTTLLFAVTYVRLTVNHVPEHSQVFWNISGLSYTSSLFGEVDLPRFFFAAMLVLSVAFLWFSCSSRREAWRLPLLLFFFFESILAVYQSYNNNVAPRLAGIKTLESLMADEKLRNVACFNFDITQQRSLDWYMWDFGVRFPAKMADFIDLAASDTKFCSEYVFTSYAEPRRIGRFKDACIEAVIESDHKSYLYNLAGRCTKRN